MRVGQIVYWTETEYVGGDGGASPCGCSVRWGRLISAPEPGGLAPVLLPPSGWWGKQKIQFVRAQALREEP